MSRVVGQSAQIGDLDPGHDPARDLEPQRSEEQHAGDRRGIERIVQEEMRQPDARDRRYITRERTPDRVTRQNFSFLGGVDIEI